MTMPFPSHCAHEAAVDRAARTGSPDPGTLAHLAECASCRETFEVGAWMTRFAADTEAAAVDRDLPDAARIWWRARLLQRWDAETRVTAPLDVMQRVEVVGGLIVAIVLLIILWPELHGFGPTASGGSTGGWWPALANLFAPSGLTTLIVGGVLLLAMMAVFTVHQLLIED